MTSFERRFGAQLTDAAADRIVRTRHRRRAGALLAAGACVVFGLGLVGRQVLDDRNTVVVDAVESPEPDRSGVAESLRVEVDESTPTTESTTTGRTKATPTNARPTNARPTTAVPTTTGATAVPAPAVDPTPSAADGGDCAGQPVIDVDFGRSEATARSGAISIGGVVVTAEDHDGAAAEPVLIRHRGVAVAGGREDKQIDVENGTNRSERLIVELPFAVCGVDVQLEGLEADDSGVGPETGRWRVGPSPDGVRATGLFSGAELSVGRWIEVTHNEPFRFIVFEATPYGHGTIDHGEPNNSDYRIGRLTTR